MSFAVRAGGDWLPLETVAKVLAGAEPFPAELEPEPPADAEKSETVP